eukprot:SAG31_NODE_7953_length_1555_cov_2.929945_2_plen_155_part_00
MRALRIFCSGNNLIQGRVWRVRVRAKVKASVPLCVVKICEAVGKTMAQVQQSHCWAASHAGIAICRAGRHTFEQAQHDAEVAPRRLRLVERQHNVHLGRARIAEDSRNARIHERVDEHRCCALMRGRSTRTCWGHQSCACRARRGPCGVAPWSR